MQHPSPITIGQHVLTFEQPILMGILNVTPDSFSDGGDALDPARAAERAWQLVEDGAQIIDVGGESTRPGAHAIDAATERSRVVPVLQRLARENFPALISIDTNKASIAEAALDTSAQIINDVSALSDPAMAAVAIERNAPIILMHMRGVPLSMQAGEIIYRDVVKDVTAWLADAIDRFQSAGGVRDNVWVDPGIGFGKTTEHCLSLTKHLDVLASLGRPIVYAGSRKTFLGELTGRPPKERTGATIAACVAALLAGAHILRVHDPALVRDACTVAHALRQAP